MSHIIHAVILKGPYLTDLAEKYDLIGVDLNFGLTMFFIDDDYLAYWEKKLNKSGYLESSCEAKNKKVIYELMKQIGLTDPVEYAVIATGYVGGMGDQFANVYRNEVNADLLIRTISAALNHLGVVKGDHVDEFDTVGLGRYRSNPDYLDKYRHMLDNPER